MIHSTHHNWMPLLLAVVAIVAPIIAEADPDDPDPATLPMHVPPFRLVDTDGEVRALSDYSDAKAVVLFMQMNGCPIVRQSYPYMEELRAKYEPKGIAFLYIAPNRWDDAESINFETDEYSATPPVAIDTHRALAMHLNVTRSAESFLVDPNTGKVLYRGMADDRFDYGLKRPNPQHFWLRDAIEARLKGNDPEKRTTLAKGCLYDMDVYTDLDYDTDLLPYLNKHLPEVAKAHPRVPEGSEAEALADRLQAMLLDIAPAGLGAGLSEHAGLAFATYIRGVRSGWRDVVRK
jgi:peroxiredoxin